MTVILWAFTLFHLAVGLASLSLALRLLTPKERAHWRSHSALLVAEFLCWIYPVRGGPVGKRTAARALLRNPDPGARIG